MTAPNEQVVTVDSTTKQIKSSNVRDRLAQDLNIGNLATNTALGLVDTKAINAGTAAATADGKAVTADGKAATALSTATSAAAAAQAASNAAAAASTAAAAALAAANSKVGSVAGANNVPGIRYFPTKPSDASLLAANTPVGTIILVNGA